MQGGPGEARALRGFLGALEWNDTLEGWAFLPTLRWACPHPSQPASGTPACRNPHMHRALSASVHLGNKQIRPDRRGSVAEH